nr:filamentous hemagglutinin N-terminal domain-containing protein [Gammaproteobacteria bacterium]
MNFKKNTLKLKKLTSAIKLYHLACAGLIAGQLAAPVAYAGPKGGHVRGGDGSIFGDGSAQVTVDQLSQFLAIDWDSFNLGSEEKINFKQGFGDNSIALNRVIGNDLSTIAGEMNANGHVVLVNPNGVIFASGSSINVGALTASTLDIDPESFISAANAAENGNFEFTLGNYFKDNTASGSSYVVNHGNITASGSVSLIGNQVINTGMIKANLVHLTAADKAVLTFDDEGLIGVEITEEVKSNPKYEGFEDAVYNAGKIEGQQIFMEARVADDLFKYAVNNDGGTVIANGIEEKDGKIMLVGSGGSVANSGELTASGGEINISSDADIKLGNKSEIETDNLEMLAGGSFKNEGTIEVDQLNLKVGVNGQNTDNVLGNITARSGRIKGGIGSDKFTLGDEQDQLEIFGHKTVTLKNENISLTFNEVESVNTGGGTDSVIGADKMDWLLGGNGTAINSGIRFSGAEEF